MELSQQENNRVFERLPGRDRVVRQTTSNKSAISKPGAGW